MPQAHTPPPQHHTPPPLLPPQYQPEFQPQSQPQPPRQPSPQPSEDEAPFRQPFSLPWYSAPGTYFPPRARRRRKVSPGKTPHPGKVSSLVAPTSDTPTLEETLHVPEASVAAQAVTEENVQVPDASPAVQATTETCTPVTTNPPSEIDSTSPATPTTTAPPSAAPSVASKPATPITTPAVPVIKPKKKAASAISTNATASEAGTAPATPTTLSETPAVAAPEPVTAAPVEQAPPVTAAPAPAPEPTAKAAAAPAKPSSWADLVKKGSQKQTAVAAAAAPPAPVVAKTNGTVAPPAFPTLAELFDGFQVKQDIVVPLLEPRGLINTGNMCFMNAILQMLVHCGPFYYFLDRISSASAKSFKNETPLLETMIQFMQEFRVVTKDSRSKIKPEDQLVRGDSFAPEYVYDTIKPLSAFSEMKRGQQQDAEEFLGLWLNALHEETIEVLKKLPAKSQTDGVNEADGEWLEVGAKNKAAITRTTETTESPISKIFGGVLRSVVNTPGRPSSVTKESFTPLQLDIQSPDVKNVVHAIKHLCSVEKIAINDSDAHRTKQFFIETLPPVLILHLKRFQHDSTFGAQKISKRIAYPLELEIPKEALSPATKRTTAHKYRLCGVVYHHGSSAQGGHYTCDVLRQDQKSWLRFDDTFVTDLGAREVELEGMEEEEGWSVEGENKGKNAGRNNRYSEKDSTKTAYILFYQKI
ncbi:hypothetical protein BZA77DRAFT_242331 [Pyronema omphalodes]|nr:hypothetical protein BZA77DRAFT_242331 [Pyronema omphalodes]